MKINVSFLAALLLVGTGLVARAAMQGVALPEEALVNASGGKSSDHFLVCSAGLDGLRFTCERRVY